MEKPKRRIVLAALSAAVIVVTAGRAGLTLADPPPGKGKNKKHEAEQSAGSGDLVRAGITAEAVRRIMIEQNIAAGYKPLPPGIRKNLARGKPLPPGIAKRYPPNALVGRLPRYNGYEWAIAGADLVLVQIATRVVADIIVRAFE